MKKIVIIGSIVIGLYIIHKYNYQYKKHNDKYIRAEAFDIYKLNSLNKVKKTFEDIDYHCIKTFYSTYTEYKKIYYNKDGSINKIKTSISFL